MAGVTLENITKKYGRKTALRSINLVCKQGEFLSVIGPTGAGKTTILKIIAGIETITSGNLYFDGRLMNGTTPQERNVSMAFETYNLYPHFKVYDNIASPLRAPRWGYHLSRNEEEKAVREIAGFLGIEELLERLPQHLSGGQKQRVSLARALVRKPQVYLLDEPIAHLDARLKFSTQTLLKEFATEYKSTIIYVTHDYREALGLSDRVVVLNNGSIEQEGTPHEVYDTPATAFVGKTVGEPPMNFIDGAVDRDKNSFVFKGDGLVSIKIADELAARVTEVAKPLHGRSYVRLGVRSEFVKVRQSKGGEDAFQLPVFAVTTDSDETIVGLQLAENNLIYARVKDGAREYKPGTNVWVELDKSHVLFYPPEPASIAAQEDGEQ